MTRGLADDLGGRVAAIAAHAIVVMQNPPAVKVSDGTSCGVLDE